MTRKRAEAVYLAHLARNSRHTVIANGDGTYTHVFTHSETPHVGILLGDGRYRSVFDALPSANDG